MRGEPHRVERQQNRMQRQNGEEMAHRAVRDEKNAGQDRGEAQRDHARLRERDQRQE